MTSMLFLEFDALDDFGQLIFTLQSSPRFRSGIDQFEYHNKLGGLADRTPFVRTVRCRTVAKHALDWI